ncbi:MAG: hypothetical protein FJX74_07155 [Armatimonadetes bacterium]|nr:hypothetical protein [Armatimonadota bacterium]
MITWEQIRRHLERDGVPFVERAGETRVLEVELRLPDGTLGVEVSYDEEHGVVRFVVPNLALPQRLPRYRHELRKALLLLNSCFILGGFSEAPHGRVVFGITLLIEGGELSYAAYRRVLNALAASVDRALPWLRQVASGALSADEGVENILDVSRRLQERETEDAQPAAVGITEDEIEAFGRALMNGAIPPPTHES